MPCNSHRLQCKALHIPKHKFTMECSNAPECMHGVLLSTFAGSTVVMNSDIPAVTTSVL